MQYLVSSVFFVYVSHIIIINYITRLHLQTTNPIANTIIYIASVALAIVICLLLYYLLNRFFPRLCAFLTGNRQRKR